MIREQSCIESPALRATRSKNMKTPIWEEKTGAMNLWVKECHRGFYSTGFRCSKVLFSGKSPYQHIDVVQTIGHGRMLLNDGIVMFSEKDEFIYHEMMAHVPLCIHPQGEQVLIIGGGDGGVARELFRHSTVKQVVLVEIDKMVVEVAKKYFPKISSSFANKKLNLKIQDGIKFVKNTKQKFDVVLVDSTDPFGPAKGLFSPAFYKDVFRILTKEGILVVQAESPFFELQTQKFILKSLKSLFPLTALYNYSNTVYPGGLWSFALASKKYHPVKDVHLDRVRSLDRQLSYYNEGIHRLAFTQPAFVKKALKGLLAV